MRQIIAFFFSLVLVLVIFACKQSPDPPPATQPSAPLIATVPGLGESQLQSINSDVTAQFPTCTLAAFGPTNGYLSDVAGYCNANTHGTLIFIGHSYGADRVCRDAGKVPRIRLLILLDPVAFGGGDDIWVPSNVDQCVVFRRTFIDVEQKAVVHGVFNEIPVADFHNGVPHNPSVILMVNSLIQGSL